MTFPEFDKVFDDLIVQCRLMRDTKGKEYANKETDRLANFKEIANELGVITKGEVRRVLTAHFKLNTYGQHLLRDNFSDMETVDELVLQLQPDPKAVLMVYLMKHVRSIEAWIKNGEVSSDEKIKGRIIDLITYAALLWGLECDMKGTVE
jgi:hypothetical protein